MSDRDREIQRLVDRAAQGAPGVLDHLLALNRPRLRKLVAVQIDSRLQARIDPSDVVQETMIEAARRFKDYLGSRPLPFYPWLRQLAIDQISRLRRDHLRRARRSAHREVSLGRLLPDDSLRELANLVPFQGSSPTQRLARKESRELVREALDRLAADDREVLVLRCLEHMTAAEAGAVLGVSEAAVRMRQLRALERLQKMIVRMSKRGTDL
jgi:RNA polymerase sigma-70 factor, ECF subfamily